jgi:heme A synthase
MSEMTPARRRFSYLAWAVLAFNVVVILGGTIVRATGSGDGCGATWPRCGGQIIPTNPSTERIIEFTHRAMSLAAGFGILALFILALVLYSKRHRVRRAAAASLVLLIIESLLGASLVLFGWVDQDASVGRQIVVPLHLTNTFLLLAALALTAWWASGKPAPSTAGRAREARWLWLGALAIIVIGASGALNALADSLFEADSVLGGVRDELDPDAPFLVQVRVFHPLLSIILGLGVAHVAQTLGRDTGEGTRRLAVIILGLVVAQFFVGITNIFLLTPLETQVIHLAMADAIWIVYVLFGASWLGEPAAVLQDAKVST